MTSAKYYEIDGKLFTAHNEASANIHDSVWTCLFNKTIAKNELDEDIYQLVRDGKWTLDRMREIIEKTTHDLNGDGNMTAEDQWGLVTHNGASFGFLHGCDARGIDIENGHSLRMQGRRQALQRDPEDTEHLLDGRRYDQR